MKSDSPVKYLLSLIGWEGTIYQLREWVRRRRFTLVGTPLAELIRQRRIACQGEAERQQEYDAGEELVVWATLIQLKAKSLLPAMGGAGTPAEGDTGEAAAEAAVAAGAGAEDDESGEAGEQEAGFDPAAWRRWIEEARAIQAAVEALAACREQAALRFPRGGVEKPPVRRDYLRPAGHSHVAELAAAWRRVAARLAPPRLPTFRSEPAWRLLLPQLVRWLRQRREAILQEWARRLERPQQVAAFLAFLELVRRGRVVGVQEGPGRPIRLVWAAKDADRQTDPQKPKQAEQEVN